MKKSTITIFVVGGTAIVTAVALCFCNASETPMNTAADLNVYDQDAVLMSDTSVESEEESVISTETKDALCDAATSDADEKELTDNSYLAVSSTPCLEVSVTPTSKPSLKPTETSYSTETPKATNTPAPTSTPKDINIQKDTSAPTSTPVPTATLAPTTIPSPTPTSVPEKSPVPAIIRVVYTVSGCNITSGFGTAWEDGDFVQVNVTREYVCQPLEGTKYHSYNVYDYEPYGSQVDPDDLFSDFYAVYPCSCVWGYGTGYVDGHLVGPEVVGFVE